MVFAAAPYTCVAAADPFNAVTPVNVKLAGLTTNEPDRYEIA
jgi:hypothetical protein